MCPGGQLQAIIVVIDRSLVVMASRCDSDSMGGRPDDRISNISTIEACMPTASPTPCILRLWHTDTWHTRVRRRLCDRTVYHLGYAQFTLLTVYITGTLLPRFLLPHIIPPHLYHHSCPLTCRYTTHHFSVAFSPDIAPYILLSVS